MTAKEAFYLLKHFTTVDHKFVELLNKQGYSEKSVKSQLKTAGSKFFFSFCQNPFQLESLLEKGALSQEINQSNERKAKVYQYSHSIGTEQIINRSLITANEIQTIKRDSFSIPIINLEILPETDKIVIVRSFNEDWITAFPGDYAPAFPSAWMNSKELELASEFWKNHVFILKASMGS